MPLGSSSVGKVTYDVGADLTPLKRDLKTAEGTIHKSGDTAATGFGANFKKALSTGDFASFVKGGFGLGAGLAVFGLLQRGISGVTGAMGDAVQAAREDEASVAQLTQAILANDAAWDGNYAAIDNVINARMRLGFSDDEQRDSLRSLVSVTGDMTEALEVQRTAMDLARLKGMSLGDATGLLGKVYAGNMGILSRYGIVLEKGATATEALAEIQRRAEGQAETYAKQGIGRMEAVDLRLGELQERFGRAFMPAVDVATGALEAFLDEIDLLSGGGETATGSSALGRLRTELGLVVDEIEAVGDAAAAAAGDWVGTGTVVDSLVDAIFGLQTGLEDLGLAPHVAQVHEWEDALRPLAEGMELTEGQLYGLVEAGINEGKTLDEMKAGFDTVAESADALTPILGSAAGGTRKMALTEEEAADAAKVLADQLDMVAGTSLPELRQSAHETFASFVKAIEATGNPLRALQREEDALMVLRRQAAREGQWWNEAAIDQRLAEIKTEKQAQRAVRDTYDETVTLYRQTGKDFSIDIPVDDSAVRGAIGTVSALLVGLSAVGGRSSGVSEDAIGSGRVEHRGLQQAERKRQQEAYRHEMERLRAETDKLTEATAGPGGSGSGGSAGAHDKNAAATKRAEEAAKAEEKALAAEEARAEKVAAAFDYMATTSFPDLQTSSQEALAELRASLDAAIDPMQVLQAEEAALMALRAEAAAKHRYDVLAAIDQRLEEIDLQERQIGIVERRYAMEDRAQDLLHRKLDISIEKAAKLLDTWREKDRYEGLTDLELARRIIGGKASGGPVGPGAYLVNERGREMLLMNGTGYILDAQKTAAVTQAASRTDVYHHVDAPSARNLAAAGFDTAGLAALLRSSTSQPRYGWTP